jgi:hypothetical protein
MYCQSGTRFLPMKWRVPSFHRRYNLRRHGRLVPCYLPANQGHPRDAVRRSRHTEFSNIIFPRAMRYRSTRFPFLHTNCIYACSCRQVTTRTVAPFRTESDFQWEGIRVAYIRLRLVWQQGQKHREARAGIHALTSAHQPDLPMLLKDEPVRDP